MKTYGAESIAALGHMGSLDDLHNMIRNHPAFSKVNNLGEDGFTLPTIKKIVTIVVNEENISYLNDMGIVISGGYGKNNIFLIDSGMKKIGLKVSFGGGSNNIIVLDRDIHLRGNLIFESGGGNIAVINAGNVNNSINATFRYNAAGLFLGVGGSAPGPNFWIEGPNNAIQVGDDYMFSWGIWVRTADSHAIVDLAAGVAINHPKSITIGRHVWLGQDVILMPGANIGAGSIVGARSIVTRSVPACCVAVGSPAKVVKRGVSWTRHAAPSPQIIYALQQENFSDI